MENGKKETRIFSGTLMKQNIKSNYLLAIAVLIIMIRFTVYYEICIGCIT